MHQDRVRILCVFNVIARQGLIARKHTQYDFEKRGADDRII